MAKKYDVEGTKSYNEKTFSINYITEEEEIASINV